MSKNLLADTDFTDGRDKRFVHSVLIGRVSKLECSDTAANVRVTMPDRLDSEGQPLITKPIPVLQVSAGGKKSFAMPRIGQNALMVKLPNSTSSYAAIGFFYTRKEKPPVKDPLVDYCEWEGGHIQKHDANEDADVFLTQDFKGGWNCTVKKDVNLKTTDGAKTNIESDGDVLIKSATGNINVESPSGVVTIKQQTIELQATDIKLTGKVTIVGAIDHTGAHETHGVHHDNKGFHTNTAKETELEERVATLEAKVASLEARIL